MGRPNGLPHVRHVAQAVSPAFGTAALHGYFAATNFTQTGL